MRRDQTRAPELMRSTLPNTDQPRIPTRSTTTQTRPCCWFVALAFSISISNASPPRRKIKDISSIHTEVHTWYIPFRWFVWFLQFARCLLHPVAPWNCGHRGGEGFLSGAHVRCCLALFVVGVIKSALTELANSLRYYPETPSARKETVQNR